MSGRCDTPEREAILNRITRQRARDDNRPDTAPLDWDDVGFLAQGLTFAGRPLNHATKSITERYSLGPRGTAVLNLIHAGVVYPNELSQVLHIGRSLVSAELARLTEAGLITSAPGTDRRTTTLSLTEAGQRVHAEARDEIHRTLTGALAAYTPAEVRHFSRMLQDLRAAFSPA